MIEVGNSPSLQDNPSCSDWLDLSTDGRVLLRTGKVEIGQGILTALVQIAADELDISPERFEVLSGHTRLGPLEAQTASSLSLEVTGRTVRMAASAVRARLAEQAATLLQTSPGAVTFMDGTVHVAGRETPLTSWSLAKEVDLDVPVLDHALPKPIAQRRVVGKALARIDLPAKLAGGAFIQDIALPGMRHGRVLQPPGFTARVVDFDRAALERRFPEVQIVHDGSFIGVIATREDMAARAIVAAENLTRWDTGEPAPADLIGAIGATPADREVVFEQGDETPGDGARLEMQTRRAYIAHASIAPSCAIAAWQGEALEVYSHTQGPHGLRDALGIVFGTDAARDITVIHKPGAGTYGHSGQDDVALDAALLARAVPGTPVRLLWSRADDFAAAPLGAAMMVNAELGIDADGRMQRLAIECASQPHSRRPGRDGAPAMTAAERLANAFESYCCDDVPLARGGGAERNATPLYAIPCIRVSKRIEKNLPVRTSALRGLGAAANVFTLEALVDDAAHASGVDAIQYRLDHLEDERAREVLMVVARMAGWPGETRSDTALGVGFAQYKNRSAYSAIIAQVKLDETISVPRVWAAVDAGEIVNPDGLRHQIEGGIIQATSFALKEAIAFDGACVTTRSWADYPILRFSEIPSIEVQMIDRPELPPLGAGETSVAPTVAAIGNAVARALGTRICTIPITREAIVAAVS